MRIMTDIICSLAHTLCRYIIGSVIAVRYARFVILLNEFYWGLGTLAYEMFPIWEVLLWNKMTWLTGFDGFVWYFQEISFTAILMSDGSCWSWTSCLPERWKGRRFRLQWIRFEWCWSLPNSDRQRNVSLDAEGEARSANDLEADRTLQQLSYLEGGRGYVRLLSDLRPSRKRLSHQEVRSLRWKVSRTPSVHFGWQRDHVVHLARSDG